MGSNRKKTVFVFASGGDLPNEGGSGFKNLVEQGLKYDYDYEVIGVASNHQYGGVRNKARELGIRFWHFPGPFTPEAYRRCISSFEPDFVALSGWLFLVKGHNPKTTFNIHPGPLPGFGGRGMHGRSVHRAVRQALRTHQIYCTEVTMHFVTSVYDDPNAVFFRCTVPLRRRDTVTSIQKVVNVAERRWQPYITNQVVTGKINWNHYPKYPPLDVITASFDRDAAGI